MKKSVNNVIRYSLIVLVIFGILASGYFMFIYSYTCTDISCFNKALIECRRSMFIKDSSETTMLYNINGPSKGKCKIDVKLLQIKEGTADLSALENKEMTCLLPLGVEIVPEQTLKNCHGLLKESIQEVMIQRLHAQIVENIGEIKEEAVNII